jgi:hypothetical protein
MAGAAVMSTRVSFASLIARQASPPLVRFSLRSSEMAKDSLGCGQVAGLPLPWIGQGPRSRLDVIDKKGR